MGNLKFKNKDRNWVDIEIYPNSRVEIEDNEGNHYEIKADKFGGIEIIASDGSISICPIVSNHIIVKTNA